MKSEDISSAAEVSTIANWNQTREDWRRILQLSPEGCRCIEDAGKVVATASLLPYGTQLAWIGMVLTRPEYRRKGFARQLLEDAMLRAEQLAIRTLKLDATEQGRPLYEGLGFVAEGTVERWGRDHRTLTAAPGKVPGDGSESRSCSATVPISDHLFALDAEAFGAGRMKLLEILSSSGRCDAAKNGYVLSRPGRTAQYLGPCIADSEAAARQLIAGCLEGSLYASEDHQGIRSYGWYWDLLSANSGAVRCAQMFGFTRRRVLWRMRHGEALENNDAMVYSIAGFELG